MSRLTEWLSNQMDARGWGYNELARRAGVSSGTVSNVMGERSNPGLDFCVGAAEALDESPEYVLRLAGLLPALDAHQAREERALHAFRQLSADQQEAAIAMLRGLAGQAPGGPAAAARYGPPSTAETDQGANQADEGEQMFYEQEPRLADLPPEEQSAYVALFQALARVASPERLHWLARFFERVGEVYDEEGG
jgi:transcriptional regulator with XRE-family HTH domain